MLRGLEPGEAAIPRGTAALVLAEFSRLKTEQFAFEPLGKSASLTSREMELLKLAASGLSNRQIADRLDISISTVKNHFRNILSKLHLKNRRQAVAYARHHGLFNTF